jgi:hypothetical protein
VRINPDNGLSAAEGNPNVTIEKFSFENIPPREPSTYNLRSSGVPFDSEGAQAGSEPIF